MTKAVFVVSKHPFGEVQDGDTRITRLLLEAAAESASVGVVTLAERPAPSQGHEILEVPKPPVRLARLAGSSAARRRSLIHTRFAPAALTRALDEVTADVLVARRAYMAQSAIDAGRVPPRDRLLVLVDVLESMVLRRRRSALRPLLALEARRTRRDELRSVRAASEVAYLSDTERDELGEGPAGPRLDLVLPAAERPAGLDDPLALFVGDRRWPPNAEALASLLALWPRIAREVPGARLLIVGAPGPGERPAELPGVETAGFVEDLDQAWRSAAVLLAPIPIGGGVRVKVLDAARHGVPVVGSPAAIGATSEYLPLSAQPGDEEFAAAAAALLADPARRRAEGEALFDVNRTLAADGFVERQLAALLG